MGCVSRLNAPPQVQREKRTTACMPIRLYPRPCGHSHPLAHGHALTHGHALALQTAQHYGYDAVHRRGEVREDGVLVAVLSSLVDDPQHRSVRGQSRIPGHPWMAPNRSHRSRPRRSHFFRGSRGGPPSLIPPTTPLRLLFFHCPALTRPSTGWVSRLFLQTLAVARVPSLPSTTTLPGKVWDPRAPPPLVLGCLSWP